MKKSILSTLLKLTFSYLEIFYSAFLLSMYNLYPFIGISNNAPQPKTLYVYCTEFYVLKAPGFDKKFSIECEYLKARYITNRNV
jgi:hypothetical protein